MDPEIALARAETALNAEDPNTTLELLKGYWDWRSKGGFEPKDGDKRATKIGKDVWAGTNEARVRDIVNSLLEDAAAQTQRFVVEFRTSSGNRGSEPWSNYGTANEDTLEKFVQEKLATVWTTGHIRAVLSDPHTGNIFARYEGDK